MTENEPRTGNEPRHEAPYKSLGERLKPVIGIIAPTTLITTMLIYFGYVATQARFQQFGVNLDLVNLASTDLLFYGSEAVYIGILGLAVIALIPVGLYLAGKWVISDPRRDRAAFWISLVLCWAGILLLIGALLAIFVPHVRGIWRGRAEIPLALTLSALLLRYALWLWQARAAHRPHAVRTLSKEAFDFCRGILLVLLLAGLFWTANNAAKRFGEMGAESMADNLKGKPRVVLFLQEPIYDLDLPTNVKVLDTGKEMKFRYRYSGLRLLVESDDRLFLAPAAWTPGTNRGILVIPNTSDIRLLLFPPQ
ncbi:hypothetical protein EDD29_3622 [Actinocorallia herbida]|uniref:Uncharacterized protein n=1 Tax=Actinocorallia herbida TaxID=58109 RepID=A0A3N1CXR3_9ACTN|nr:hypothetical protein [Actinocorallia herbida]ROO86061.1 hypothetical protein EDD29_3622 [Actinocorallia herbida]